MSYIIRLFNGQTPEQNEGRLHRLKEVTQEIELFPEQYQVASDLEEGFQNETERPPLLAFVHYGEWTDIGQSFDSWSPMAREYSYLLLFSGGGISDPDAERIRDAAAGVDEFENHVYVLQQPFPADTDLLKQFVHEFTSFFSGEPVPRDSSPPPTSTSDSGSETSELNVQDPKTSRGTPDSKAETSRSASQDVTQSDDRDREDLHEALQDIVDRLNRGEADIQILPALSILCQGYLAVHAEHYGHQENVDAALEQMNWYDLVESGQEMEIPLLKNLANKQDKVRDPGWWKKTLNVSSWTYQAEEEWKRDSEDGWESVASLIDSISQNEDLSPETVATAYCKLVERLGGEPCP